MRYADFSWHDPILWAQGLGVSVGIFLVSSLIGLVIGCAFALTRYYRVPGLWQLLHLTAELLKNSPVLVQLFLVYFGIPAFTGIRITPVEAAIITLSANTGAFIYVIAVSAMDSIDRDQIEAAKVFGLSRWQTVRKVIFPQALAFAAGPLISLAVNQLQVTSLVSVIGVIDLTKVGHILNLRTLKPFIVWTVIGVTYYALAKIVAWAGWRLERRFRRHAQWAGL